MPRVMFQRPRRIEWEELGPRFGRMIAEPFEKGYALTVGNSLRRVLLAAIPGAALTWVRIDGVRPDEVRVPGLREDLPTFLLALKRVTIQLADDQARTVRVELTGPRTLTAGDLRAEGVEIVDPETPLATLEAGSRLGFEVGLQPGRGYVSAGRHAGELPEGAIPLDAAFSPIRRVNYTVEMSRLGKITDYEKLVLEVWTNGTITPDQAVLRAAGLLRDHFDLFTPAGAEEEDEESAVPGEATKQG